MIKSHTIKRVTVQGRPLWWFSSAVFIGLYAAYEITHGNPEFVKGFMYATFLYFGAHFIRFRLDWSLLDHSLNWEKIEQIEQDSPTQE